MLRPLDLGAPRPEPDAVIEVEQVRLLGLEEAPGRPPHLSAASGLVPTAAAIYVIADDENGLGVFPREGGAPGRLLPLFDDVLPDDPRERKAAKPDLEALCRLPAHPGSPHGALLACGSGSAPPRHRGVQLQLDAAGALTAAPRPVELRPLYDALRRELPELNVEGATVAGEELLLASRGNGSRRENAVIRLPLDPVLAALAAGEPLVPDLLAGIDRVELPALGEQGLAFSDLATLPDGRVLYSAIGEKTDDPYEDGAFTGAGVGILGGPLHAVVPPAKVEGLAAVGDVLLLTADADDRSVAAPLLRAPLAALGQPHGART